MGIASLVHAGSILSNMLLVLGMSFFAAGLVMEESRFSAKGASANMTCLTLGSIALALPTIYNCMEARSNCLGYVWQCPSCYLCYADYAAGNLIILKDD